MASLVRHGRMLFVIAAALLACGPAPVADERPTVAVSVLPQAWILDQLAGDRVNIAVMIPPGANEATYEPTMKQMRAVQRARLYVKVGHPDFPFEAAWLDELLRDTPDIEVLEGFEGVPFATGDPHPWTAPSSMRVAVDRVAEALTRLWPEWTSELELRRRSAQARIEALDAELRASLGAHVGRRFYVFHPAWGYFARDYGLEQVSIEHDHKEPSAAELSRLIAQARSDGARMIVVQPHFSTQSAATVAEAVGAQLVAADPLARDWEDGLRRFARILAAELSGSGPAAQQEAGS